MSTSGQLGRDGGELGHARESVRGASGSRESVERVHARWGRMRTYRDAVAAGPIGAARRIEVALVHHGCCCCCWDRSCEARGDRTSTGGARCPERAGRGRRDAGDLIFRSLSLQFSRHAGSAFTQNF
ncbi:hypothetical protein RR46_08554 [Papilio xuthus]|uniref:Uncharacterized protein n=1 Tax=Papilio xuthus TaxID=66420 RepID=A0A194Q7K1_PAPXU|nr:hypothetical protein RR46_08554 [Papilio xuthus]